MPWVLVIGSSKSSQNVAHRGRTAIGHIFYIFEGGRKKFYGAMYSKLWPPPPLGKKIKQICRNKLTLPLDKLNEANTFQNAYSYLLGKTVSWPPIILPIIELFILNISMIFTIWILFTPFSGPTNKNIFLWLPLPIQENWGNPFLPTHITFKEFATILNVSRFAKF